jgi:hypothetical protein
MVLQNMPNNSLDYTSLHLIAALEIDVRLAIIQSLATFGWSNPKRQHAIVNGAILEAT